MKKNIFILGNFGYYSNDLNGQTMRTRTIYKSLNRYLNDSKYNIKFTDTSVKGSKIKVLMNYLRGLKYWFTSKSIILLPAQKAIKYVVPLFYYVNTILKRKIHFIAIGGWLRDFLDENNNYTKYFQKMNTIYVQTKSLKKKLENKGLNNVIHFPNFRIYDDHDIEIKEIDEVKKVVFFSRVIKAKGIELAVSAINKINKEREQKIELYIYGPVGSDYLDDFNKLKQSSPFIRYNGVLEPEKIISELSIYDFMIFPTYYEGEGFPGTILDSMSAGVPVIASDWKYNSEIIKDEFTGLLFKSQNLDELIQKMNLLIRNTSLINQMKRNCLNESKKYSESIVMPELLGKLTEK
ncbi:glycosyltransferase family 4 protein [Halalkalibacterium halodurans]|uniref:glycosyltransferase family 4 protein n=3 Tax=Halalkalibacterium halodurans TaxID=86665 RepID=UPI002E248975|nr:glycosyltransferase family 4 protein [Halalkalibacterium halodurans]MED4083728.1 glycosyltransferase family 4 protein [Halalkalibacterium halodurans]MED4106583.1 glycosyltransferase family 4 protein [Halalkalibacterium halodurans]MED4109569.1 glycosyltransferase family 4 protein [Halalkalibacterium halodurans]MED4191648.1 glycosyltransferase family 4 protein [Halalkalibacterium halodurans]